MSKKKSSKRKEKNEEVQHEEVKGDNIIPASKKKCDESESSMEERERKRSKKKHEKKDKKKGKRHKKEKNGDDADRTDSDLGRSIVSSALDFKEKSEGVVCKDGVTLLLFYQYVEPPWTPAQHQKALTWAQESGDHLGLGGRMRIAREGFNCTLTGTYDNIRKWCKELRAFCPEFFSETEFKLTDNLPQGQMFPKLHCFPVEELVHYGLAGDLAPPISESATHLEPEDYHQKMAEKDTVIIDVRNHYEAVIGHFQPPEGGAELVDPLMRKSTEFPAWLDKPETKEKLRGKQVLMYCTGGVRCERASALLRQKIATEDEMKVLGITGVYQLQGGIDKYFKKFPGGGFWNGKNYVFDKRFAHAPQKIEATQSDHQPISKCEACTQPWDKYRGKRRCPTCGVPSLICRECFVADENGSKKLDRSIRCKLCVEQNIISKAQIKARQKQELEEHSKKFSSKKRLGASTVKNRSSDAHEELMEDVSGYKAVDNPEKATRLYVSNLCRNHMDENVLTKALPAVTYVLWLKDRHTGQFNGSCLVEMESPEAASIAVGRNGMRVLGRQMKVKFQKADGKDLWPPPAAIKLK